MPNLIVYGVLGVFVGIGVLLGLRRGFNRQTIKFATVLLSFIFSLLIFDKIFPLFFSFAKGKTVDGMLTGVGLTLPQDIRSILTTIDADAASYLLAVPMAVAILPLSFVGCVFVLGWLLWIPGYVLCGTMGFIKRCNTKLTRILGALMGALQGAFIAVIILVPVAGMAGIATSAVNDVRERHPESQNSITVSSFHQNFIEPLESNVVLKFIDGKLGFIYDRLTNVEVDGKEIAMGDMAKNFYEVFVLYGDLEDFDYKRLTEENKVTITDMIDIMTKDEYMSTITAGAMKSLSLNIEKIKFITDMEEPVGGFVRELLLVYDTTSKETAKGDLYTTRNVYFIFSDTGSLAVMDEPGSMTQNMFKALLVKDAEGHSTVSLIADEFELNQRFVGVSNKLSSLAMEILIKNSGMSGDDTAEKLTNVKDGLNDIIKIEKDGKTEEEYKAEVSGSLDETLKNNGIALPPEKLDKLTDEVIKEFGDKEEDMTDLEFAEFMGNYYDIYNEETETEP